jgi:hypothetical protein
MAALKISSSKPRAIMDSWNSIILMMLKMPLMVWMVMSYTDNASLSNSRKTNEVRSLLIPSVLIVANQAIGLVIVLLVIGAIVVTSADKKDIYRLSAPTLIVPVVALAMEGLGVM